MAMDEYVKWLDVQNLCRICLKVLPTDANYDLFEVPELAMKLFACASLKVAPQDGYPRRICSSCFTKLNDFHDFQILCQESLLRFDALVENKQISITATTDNFVNILETTNTFVEVPPYKDVMQPTINDKDLHEFDPLLTTKMECIEEEELVFNMSEAANLKTGTKNTNSEASDSDDNDKSSSERWRQSRQTSENDVTDNSSLADDMCKEKLPYKCTTADCQRAFTTPRGLRLHGEQCHLKSSDSFSCPEAGCDKKFPHHFQLNGHLSRVHKSFKQLRKISYPCSVCDKVFSARFSLKKHMFKHDGKTLPFACNICEKRFVTNSALKDHLMRHAGIKNYTCPYCGVGKTTRQEWNAHLALHNNEKNFKCDLCSYATHNKQNLRMHVKLVHQKIRDYACQYCGKTFGKSNACKMHEMAHTGEKRCECKICGKRFLYAKSLTKHLKTHEKRVLCAIEVYRKRQQVNNKDDHDDNGADKTVLTSLTDLDDHSKETHQKVADKILKVCAESAASIPKNPRLVERVQIEQLAGTIINPLPEVVVPSLSPTIDFMMKEGPHVCQDCGQGFNGSRNLRRHHRTVHQGVKNFSCRFCYKLFAKSQTLKHHEMRHTGEKPHECKECGKRFIQRVAMIRHMKVHSKPLVAEKAAPIVVGDNHNANPLE